MILIEVVVEQAHVHAVEPAVLSYCAETGDVVLGRHYDEEFDQWLFVIHLREQGSRAKRVQTVRRPSSSKPSCRLPSCKATCCASLPRTSVKRCVRSPWHSGMPGYLTGRANTLSFSATTDRWSPANKRHG